MTGGASLYVGCDDDDAYDDSLIWGILGKASRFLSLGLNDFPIDFLIKSRVPVLSIQGVGFL